MTAANGGNEPTKDLGFFRCARSQHGFFCGRVDFRAATQRKDRPITDRAAIFRQPIYGSRDEVQIRYS